MSSNAGLREPWPLATGRWNPATLRTWRAGVACGFVFLQAVLVVAAEPGTTAPAPAWLDRIDLVDLKRHASFLASDTLEGRQSGTRGSQAAAAYLAAELRRLGLQPAGTGGDYRQPFSTSYTNVVGHRAGTDPTLSHELIVVGAHYDHVGYGNSSNSYGPFGVIHNGADDNASGVSALLEVAQALTAAEYQPRRTIVFGFWDGEEVALLGSQHWVANTPNAGNTVKFALNLDMIGRLRPAGVQVMGWRSAPGLRCALSAANEAEQLPFEFGAVVTPDSDHQSFYAARIPVLHFDTGKHDDYHRPTDDVERLNWIGLRQIARVAAQLVATAATAESLPAFRRDAFHERVPAVIARQERTAAPVRFGFRWHPERAREDVIEIQSVMPGHPAALAGLLPGDRLVRFGRWTRGTLDALRHEITWSPRETAVTWHRAGTTSPLTAVVQLVGDPIRWGATGRADPAVPDGLLVTEVIDTSPAALAGIEPGDYVLEVGGKPFTPEAWAALEQATPAVKLVVERQGQRRQLVANTSLEMISAERQPAVSE